MCAVGAIPTAFAPPLGARHLLAPLPPPPPLPTHALTRSRSTRARPHKHTNDTDLETRSVPRLLPRIAHPCAHSKWPCPPTTGAARLAHGHPRAKQHARAADAPLLHALPIDADSLPTSPHSSRPSKMLPHTRPLRFHTRILELLRRNSTCSLLHFLARLLVSGQRRSRSSLTTRLLFHMVITRKTCSCIPTSSLLSPPSFLSRPYSHPNLGVSMT